MKSLPLIDEELIFLSLTAREIVESLTIEDVERFLHSLGVEDLIVQPQKGYIICPTICHNPIDAEASMKLYWYQDRHAFRCYTECSEWMSIFELYQRYMNLNYHPITIQEAEDYVRTFLTTAVTIDTSQFSSFEKTKAKYEYDKNIPDYNILPDTILDCFTHYYHPTWLRDGISKTAMDKFNIRFSIAQNKIVIPHYNSEGKLIGIRGRALDEEEVAAGRKYMPIILGDHLYNHELGLNLYGLYEHKTSIKQARIAVVAEAEKSVLLDETFYPNEGICVATCGHSLNKYQIKLLLDLGVQEIIIAWDKEYNDWHSKEAYNWKQTAILKQCNPYKNLVEFSYIWDYDNKLNKKDSPYDKGKETFEYLYKTRVKVK